MQKDVRLGVSAFHAFAILAGTLFATSPIRGNDWPYHRGKGNTGVWEETGILEKFPEEGLASRVRWRMPISAGYSGPAVADGRVVITDFRYTKRPFGMERALAFDEKTGKLLWTREWETNYTGIGYDRGPRTTPTIDDDRVYLLGSAGMFLCLDVRTGEVLWKYDFVTDFGGSAHRDQWITNYGMVAPPLIDGDKLIAKVGGEPNANVVAFDRKTGKEIWRALSSKRHPGYSPLQIIDAAGVRQLIVWNDLGIWSLDPENGKIYWQYDWSPTNSTGVPTPILAGSLLYFSGYYQGSLMLRLNQEKPGARLVWKEQSESETVTENLHSLMATPYIIDGYIYGFDSHGELRCLVAETGERVWESQVVNKERALHASAQWVRHGDRFFINNDIGELIIGKVDPKGYTEISRTKLITPTTPASQRRIGGKINWTAPAFANKHIITRNDEEIISINLAADFKPEK
jgi:outer membrane protein assembly factor BamB